MKKLIFILLSILLFGAIFSFYHFSSQKKFSYVYKDCNEIILPSMKEICKAVLSKNLSICKNFPNNFKFLCYDFFFQYVDEIDEKECENVEDKRCYDRLAILKNNISYCELGTKEFCRIKYAIYKNDLTYCLGICPDDRRYCIMKLAKTREDCDTIKNESDKKYCELIVTKNTIEKCKVVYYLTDSPTIIFDDECLFDLAIEHKNFSICDMIELNDIKWKCFGYLDKKLCEKSENSFWRDYCTLHNILKRG